TDPLFTSAPSYTGAPFTGGDYSLFLCSPAVDAGSNGYLPSGIMTDLAGGQRIYGSGVVDMGAYENQGTGGSAVPTVPSPQLVGNDGTVADLVATGAGLQWYDTPAGG